MIAWAYELYKKWLEQHGNALPSAPDNPVPNGPSPVPSRVFRWIHRERDLGGVTLNALHTAKNGAWRLLPKNDLIRQVRALMLASLRAAAISPYEPAQLGHLDGSMYSTPERNAAASALARTAVLLAPPLPLRASRDIISDGANPATGHVEVGFGPVVVVVLGTVAALAAAFMASSIAIAIVGKNFDDNVTKRLLATQARAVEIMAMHIERERIAGRELPFDENELLLLQSLEDQQRRLATLQRRPLPSPFRGATEFAKAATAATTSLLPIAIVALGAFFLLQQDNRR